ncbi:unnamed protein product [Adineta steineri]|uniref:Uncharacterized protein n=1 Tax=Adineta steineri TaxID=433720 RepID=A0A814Y645_9BILA|nr:unnamed protein product [Adineta steineri]CAF1515948.1 unnamed protein product [Adineta steineri]
MASGNTTKYGHEWSYFSVYDRSRSGLFDLDNGDTINWKCTNRLCHAFVLTERKRVEQQYDKHDSRKWPGSTTQLLPDIQT